MAAGTSLSFFLIVCFLVCSSDAQEIITADLGQDVILPCKVPNINNINIITGVEWSRPDQDPEYVLVYRDGRFDPHNQHPSYQNRVDLQDKEMKDGDFSLILKNVKMEDRGTYMCRVFEKGKKDPISNITLEVHPSAPTNITAEPGQDVILPCKVPNNNNKITAVEWRRLDQGPDYVVVYRDGRLGPYKQHPSYENRTDMKDKEMKDGDFSLILKNILKNDTGTYECRVFEDGKNEPISITYMELNLSGNQPGNPGDGGDNFVLFVLLAVFAVVFVGLGFLSCWLCKRCRRQNLPVPRDVAEAIEMLPVPEQHQNQPELV